MKEKIKVSKEVFQKNFCPGWCKYCIYFDEEKEICEEEKKAREFTISEGKKLGYTQSDLDKMDCFMWEYKYTT